MKYYHDRGTKVLTPLKEGDKVYYKKTPSSSWMPAKVTKVGPSPRSFIVTSPEGIDYRRNRHHILKPNSTTDVTDIIYLNPTRQMMNPITHKKKKTLMKSKTFPVPVHLICLIVFPRNHLHLMALLHAVVQT
ncbi:hypothetical protein QE152_g15393 [Popillia japonica]|uniref:Uncharacterized protein n=1 Tax=Popillia japonica TaxID=7064 RepID=A0AAW1L845_POPJA